MHERSLVSVKDKPRSTSRSISTLYILPLFYLRDQNFRALTCVAKTASVEINLYFDPALEKSVESFTMAATVTSCIFIIFPSNYT